MEEKFDYDLKILRQWLEKQPHLPQNIHEMMLKRFLHTCNHSIEQTKNLIEVFYTIRSQTPEIFSNRDPLDEGVQKMFDLCDFIPLPKLTKDNNKVFIYDIRSSDVEKYDFVNGAKAFFMLADVRMIVDQDFADGEIPVYDMRNFTLKHLTKVVLSVLKKYMMYTQEAHPIKLKAIHLLNAPAFIDRCLAIVRPFLKSEVGKMIHFHLAGSETLFDYVPKELLPEEYGGSAGKMDDLKQYWMDEVIKNKDYLMDASRWVVNDSKRTTNNNNNKIKSTGMEGSFRSLNID